MKKWGVIFLCLFFCAGVHAYEGERLVTHATDEQAEGTLRTVLRAACDDPGDDFIHFDLTRLAEIRIMLQSPLVIPPDCAGKIALEGSAQVDTILDGANIPPLSLPFASCTLNIYSGGHTIKNLTFSSNHYGIGLCVFGRGNTIRYNLVGVTRKGDPEPNLYGIWVTNVFAGQYPSMDGSENQIIGNIINANMNEGLLLEADKLTISGNKITDNGRAGILVQNDATDILIGGDIFSRDANIIRHNNEGGVVIMGNDTEGVTVTHNRISRNEGILLDLDLWGDGLTNNDSRDLDNGPNTLLNFVDYYQGLPLVDSPRGESRYWGWGIAMSGNNLELYSVAPEDGQKTNGGGDSFIGDYDVNNKTFETGVAVVAPADKVATATALSFDEYGNTSEYSLNVAIGIDTDADGIINNFEKGVGMGAQGSHPEYPDTDGDLLPDSVEDRNRNGIWDKNLGETSSTMADSDNDGVNDWAETHGDGIYDRGIDTDPLKPDTDGDGLPDGQEDKNGNGIWDVDETSPLLADSDGDGVNDNKDNCPTLYNPYQEPWFCVP